MHWLLIAASEADSSFVNEALIVFYTLFKMAAGLGFVIFVHELGHFLVAKACGVKCEKFYVGFDIFNLRICRFQWGETEYGIGALPLGGYVKMLGQDDDPRNYQKEVERSQAGDETERAKAIQEGKAAEGLMAGKTVEKQDQKLVLDPRSYLAKSVPARMAIISAGVIMNVIFAVLMAAVAFKMGVTDVPAIVGSVAPGSPAWAANWQPGDRIVQFGKTGKPSDNVRFLDLKKQVAFNGARGPIDVLIRHTNGEEAWYKIDPAASDSKRPNRSRMIGVTPALAREIAPSPPTDLLPQAVATPPLAARDEIVAVNDEPVAELNGKPIRHAALVLAEMANHPSGPLKLTVLRHKQDDDGKRTSDEPERIDMQLSPVTMRGIGVEMKMGPVTAVRSGSPAAKAGLKEGDIITTLDGEPVGDPLALPQKLVDKVGQEITLGITRGKENLDIAVTPIAPKNIDGPQVSGGPCGIDGLGIAYSVSNEIAKVRPGSTAEAAKLKPGQAITQMQFVIPEESNSKPDQEKAKKEKELLTLVGIKSDKPLDITAEGSNSWLRAAAILHTFPVGTQVKLTVATDGKWETRQVATEELSGSLDPTRDLNLVTLTFIQKAETWQEAFQLGFNRTKDNLLEVLTILDRLRTRDVPFSSVSGPLGILSVTYQVAKQSIADLLMLLAYLGANLAVINMLPIPVLDGGHLVFLAYEGIRGKPADPEWQIRLSVVGLLFLLSVMVYATAMDFGLREFFMN